ncbi:hypothetical protein Pmani_007407 [Petrolisthes manimaculis]|uniref:Peptidase S1 domain-containing protein n=1 Tax=Petrolisthes manimaculis TaxID=1843537 RepID=A0AAE1Q8J9_9EUCA|nr:hypothetical protein Pmani_007407 [Petrolisthes manimaculis]
MTLFQMPPSEQWSRQCRSRKRKRTSKKESRKRDSSYPRVQPPAHQGGPTSVSSDGCGSSLEGLPYIHKGSPEIWATMSREASLKTPPYMANTQMDVPSGGDPDDHFIMHGIISEYPWNHMHNISSHTPLPNHTRTDPFWACGGTLITEQYVDTAAHCVHQTYTHGATLEVVRLGEYDLSSVEDCSGHGLEISLGHGSRVTCAAPTQDFTPEQVILHPDFDTWTQLSDDIALIRLNKKATLNGYVNPLCLPPAGAVVEALLGGREAEICFGGLAQDSCKGDSGGPLVLKESNPLLIGIVSRGLDRRCGLVGIPAVYTHVAAYRTWITQNIKA